MLILNCNISKYDKFKEERNSSLRKNLVPYSVPKGKKKEINTSVKDISCVRKQHSIEKGKNC